MLLLPNLLSAGHTFAIVLAVLGAALLAIGTHLQHTAVNRGSRLLLSPIWLVGSTFIVLETVFNVLALGLAPVALIQPLGTVSLVFSVLIGARALRIPLARRTMCAVVLVIASVAVFVSTAAQHMEASPASEQAAGVLAGGLFAVATVGVFVARSSVGHTNRVFAAGVLFGGVASGAHVAAMAVLAGDGLSPAVWLVVGALAPASAVGIWLVQTAYASGSAESVLAGLTVIDPITAVTVGGVVLGEFGVIPPASIALLVLSAAGALWGVKLLVQCRPGALQTPTSPVMSVPAVNIEGARGEGVPAHL